MALSARTLPGAMALGWWLSVPLPASASVEPAGAQIAGTCAACHRLDGRGTGIPPVVGLDEASITRAMLAYRSGERASQIMHVVASALTLEEITTVAHYLAGLAPAAGGP